MINYPQGINKNKEKTELPSFKYKNRGMSLEDIINKTNHYYFQKNKALIFKNPTPIQVVKVKKSKINKGFFDNNFLVDYSGIYKGKYITFEAKTTSSKTSFPMSNLKCHQEEFLIKCEEHRGISFLIISFTHFNEYYFYPVHKMKKYFENNEKSSIPYQEIQKNGVLIPLKVAPLLDYLSIIDSLYF